MPMKDAPTIEKVTNLIKLTASSNVEEARTAAAMACRIIREKDFAIIGSEFLDAVLAQERLVKDLRSDNSKLRAEVLRLKKVLNSMYGAAGTTKTKAEILESLGEQLSGVDALREAIAFSAKKGENF
jgi:hypothetical protein